MAANLQRMRAAVSLICLLALALAGASPAAGGPVEQRSPGGGTASVQATPAEQAAAAAMWTREARLAARPLPWPVVPSLPPGAGAEASGAPGFSPSGLPAPGSDAAARREFASEWTVPAAGPAPAAPAGTAGLYDSYAANLYGSHMWLDFPFAAVGKLYFHPWDGGSASCSASVISGNNIIVTAAHCVYDNVNKKWHKDWAFVPAERNGAAPYGVFPSVGARALSAYVTGSGVAAWRYDVAVISLGDNTAGHPVTYYTGFLGRSWDGSYVQSLSAFGFPSNLMSGAYSWVCQAESFQKDVDLLGLGCNQMAGSSGGPWIRTYKPYQSGSNNYVTATVSGGILDSSYGNTFYGPRFSSDNIVPLCTDEGC